MDIWKPLFVVFNVLDFILDTTYSHSTRQGCW